MKHATFLDLEETLVVSWSNHMIVNEPQVRSFLEGERRLVGISDEAPLEVELFSFAVGGDRDRDEFNSLLGPWLEEKYNIKFTQVHTCAEMAKVVSRYMNVVFDGPYEAISILGKGRLFFEFVKAQMLVRDIKSASLLDDVVQTCSLVIHKGNKEIRLIRVEDVDYDS